MEHFDHVTLSWDLKCVKPDPAIYRHAVDGLGVAAADALFIDGKEVNVEGARAAGLPAELYSNWERFLGDGVPQRYGLPVNLSP
jgi:HAD superfamily hydrolase (TIGR01509 family)